MKISREGAVIILLGAADLATTLWYTQSQGAYEGNPLMRFFLSQGVLAFILAKIAFSAGPLAFLEWARKRHPRFVRGALRTAIAIYVGAYAFGLWGASQDFFAAAYAESERVIALGERAYPYVDSHGNLRARSRL